MRDDATLLRKLDIFYSEDGKRFVDTESMLGNIKEQYRSMVYSHNQSAGGPLVADLNEALLAAFRQAIATVVKNRAGILPDRTKVPKRYAGSKIL